MRILLTVIATVFVSIMAPEGFAQSAPRKAALEARLIEDSMGCPVAVDVWLVSTNDTIQGMEILLQWDRPDCIQFVRGKGKDPKAQNGMDSLTAMLKPSDPSTQVSVQRKESLLSGWEFVDARSSNGLAVKVLGVAKLFGQEEPSPVLPGAVGRLFRLPISITRPPIGAPEPDSAVLSFDLALTRFSTPGAVLFTSVAAKSIAIEMGKCKRSPATRPRGQ